MKNFMRKVNRGLVLGGVLIIGVTVYVVADYKRFDSEKPEVEELVREYVGAFAEFNITPEQYRETSIQYSKEDSINRIAEFNEFADKYWIDTENSELDIFSYFVNKDRFSAAMQNLIDFEERGYITEFSIDITDMKIKKDGPDAAVATFTSHYFFKGTEDSAIISPAGFNAHYSFYDPNDPVEPRFMQNSFSEETIINLVRKSDGWKITKGLSESNYDIEVTPIRSDDSEDKA